MKHSHKNDKELKEIQFLKQENKKLRRQIGKLRKVISKIDMDHYEFAKDLLESQAAQDEHALHVAEQQKVEEKWECHDCGDGTLRLIVFNRADGPRYFRKCDNCGKRTKLKKFTDDVKGVK